MQKTTIGVIEDEAIVAMGITQALNDLGYTVPNSAANYTQALEMIGINKPDILLIDIFLGGYKDGIDLALKVKKEYGIPFIFLTANSDAATVDRAKKAEAQAYLVKPFRKEELFASIELCLYNYARQQKQPAAQNNYLVNNCLFIKKGQYFQKVAIDDILYLESEGVYLNVHTRDGKLLVRSNLQDYLDLIACDNFYKVHRSYAVNLRHVQRINFDSLYINNIELPLARTTRDNLLSKLKIS